MQVRILERSLEKSFGVTLQEISGGASKRNFKKSLGTNSESFRNLFRMNSGKNYRENFQRNLRVSSIATPEGISFAYPEKTFWKYFRTTNSWRNFERNFQRNSYAASEDFPRGPSEEFFESTLINQQELLKFIFPEKLYRREITE